MSQFGGILFALEQAVSRDVARKNGVGNNTSALDAQCIASEDNVEVSTVVGVTGPPCEGSLVGAADGATEVASSPPPRVPLDGARDNLMNSGDSGYCELHCIGRHLEQVLNFEDEDEHSIDVSTKANDRSHNHSPPEKNEAQMKVRMGKRASQLRAEVSQFRPALTVAVDRAEGERKVNHEISVPKKNLRIEKIVAEETKGVLLKTTFRNLRKNIRSKKRRQRRQLLNQSNSMEAKALPSQKLHATSSMSLQDESSGQEEKDPYPWRKYIPEGTVDPISLELLAEMPYPPFALVVDEPYCAVGEGWADAGEEMSVGRNQIGINEHEEIAILKQQWGDEVPVKWERKQDDDKTSLSGRKFNLFDGRVLSAYLISTQQFIDPYNRRCLARCELVALDEYLVDYALGYAGVVESFDNRATIITAGSHVQSAAGHAAARAEILRHNADTILTQIFTGAQRQASTKIKSINNRKGNSSFKINVVDRESMASSQSTKASRERDKSTQRHNSHTLASNIQFEPSADAADTGMYGAEGFLLIDNDINPGLRGRVEVTGECSQVAQQFPSLTTKKIHTTKTLTATAAATTTAPPKWGSDSLSSVYKPSEKINPISAKNQRKTKESTKESNKRPKNKTSGSRPECAYWQPISKAKNTEQRMKSPSREYSKLTLLSSGTASEVASTTASSLPEKGEGTATPASALKGWRRLAHQTANVNPAKYSVSLIAKATVHMKELVYVEKQLIQFLLDDKKPSLSIELLEPIGSIPLQKFIHDYCRCWKLRTKGMDVFQDPGKKFSIDCNKLDNTAAPYPLLSVAAMHPVLGVTVANKKKKKRAPFPYVAEADTCSVIDATVASNN